MVKKEKSYSSLPSKSAQIDLTIKSPISQKRNNVEGTDLSIENLKIEEALKKLVSFSQAVCIPRILVFSFCFLILLLLMMFLFHVSDHISLSTADLKIRVEKAERALKEQEEV